MLWKPSRFLKLPTNIKNRAQHYTTIIQVKHLIKESQLNKIDMKKMIILFFAIIPFLTNCSKDDETDITGQAREIAWDSLSQQEKATVIIDWRTAPVAETDYNNKSAYAVNLHTSDEALLGPITVYIDKNSLAVLGQATRM